MDYNTLSVGAVVICCCVGAVAAVRADQRVLGNPREHISIFLTDTLVRALDAPSMRWFNDMLRRDKASFLRIYKLVYAAWPVKPHHNVENRIIKRVALTMMYLDQGGDIDQSARVLGISSIRAVVYVNETMAVTGVGKATQHKREEALDRSDPRAKALKRRP